MALLTMSRTVLIVEDSPQMAANLEIALASVDGVDVRIATTGVDAIEMLQQLDGEPVAAVITDLDLPRLNGFQLIEFLRANPRYARTPIIVSSGSTDPDSPARALRLGADAYFAKPYSPIELRRKLKCLLEEKR